MKYIFSFLFCIIFLNASLAQRVYDKGLHITSKGVINAIAVFVQYKDDTSHPESEEWPINKPPKFLHTYLDSDLDQTSEPWSFSDYYRKMSMDSLRIIGKSFHVITNHSEDYYRNLPTEKGKSKVHNDDAFWLSNKEVLETLDAKINYAEFDNWTFGNYRHFNKPDGQVDLIIILYRNSVYPPGGPAQGIAVLGYGKGITLDGKEIKFGFPGSGITNSGGAQGMRRTLSSMKHEFGHLLFGTGHPTYFNAGSKGQITYLGMWGIMPLPGYSANAFEREKLGWINYITISSDTSVALKDFNSSGMAAYIPINHNEAYIVENHQQTSIYDADIDQHNDRGLFVYRVVGKGNLPSYDVVSADGSYNWSNYWVQHPWKDDPEDSLPVYQKLEPNIRGYDIRDWIPHDKQKYLNGKFQIFILDDDESDGYKLIDGWRGSGNTAFKPKGNYIFAPWTNPSSGFSSNIAMVITDESKGEISADFYVNDIAVTENTILPAEEFSFRGNLIVPNGVTLTIPKGAVINFKEGKKLIEHGRVIRE